MCYWNDNTSRKYKEAAADLILTRRALGGQLVVFGRVSCMKRKINCIMFDLATSKGGPWWEGTPGCISTSAKAYQRVYVLDYYRLPRCHGVLYRALPLGYRRC